MSEGQEDNPFTSPKGEPEHLAINYIWPAIGFALGTGVVGSLVLSPNVLDRGMVGALFGGVPFGLLGLWYAISRRNHPTT
jgi:hypothetical protein